jgi:hypothetical protein
MPIGSGLDSQIGFGVESTIGTRATPTIFFPFLDEGLDLMKGRIVSKGIGYGRRFPRLWRPGVQEVKGPVRWEFAPQGVDKILEWMWGGTPVKTGAGPFTRVFTPGDLDGKGMTIQVGRPDAEAGVINPFDYLGCQATEWGFTVKAGNEFVIASATVYGQHEDTSQTLATPSLPSGFVPFSALSCSLTIGGSEYVIEDASVTGNNGLVTGRHRITATNAARPRRSREGAQHRKYGGTLNGDYLGNTAYNRFVNGTEAALSIVMSDGASAQLTIAGNVRFDGETPKVKGPGPIKQSMPYEFFSTTSDAAAFTATLINSDA